MSILKLENVSYSYNDKTKVLCDINCSFDQGKMYAIVGHSGAGKSTLLSLLSGLDSPDEGEILFNENSIRNTDLFAYRRNDVGIIYQDFALLPLLTVLENIMYPMRLNGEKPKPSKDKATELAKRVNLKESLYDALPSEISGGEQQRVAIARALSNDRKLLLADEPTGNLDSENSDNIIELLLDLAHTKNHCVIVVTHDPSVEERADVVYKLENKTLVLK